MQNISSIHPFVLVIQQILKSHGLKGATPIFDHVYQIIISYAEFVSVYSIDSFMSYSQFKSPLARVTTPIFDRIESNIFY